MPSVRVVIILAVRVVENIPGDDYEVFREIDARELYARLQRRGVHELRNSDCSGPARSASARYLPPPPPPPPPRYRSAWNRLRPRSICEQGGRRFLELVQFIGSAGVRRINAQSKNGGSGDVPGTRLLDQHTVYLSAAAPGPRGVCLPQGGQPARLAAPPPRNGPPPRIDANGSEISARLSARAGPSGWAVGRRWRRNEQLSYNLRTLQPSRRALA